MGICNGCEIIFGKGEDARKWLCAYPAPKNGRHAPCYPFASHPPGSCSILPNRCHHVTSGLCMTSAPAVHPRLTALTAAFFVSLVFLLVPSFCFTHPHWIIAALIHREVQFVP